jgi:hypothetical protein
MEPVRYLLPVRPYGRHPPYVQSDILRKMVHSIPLQHSGEGEPSMLHLPTCPKELRFPALDTKPTLGQLARYRLDSFADER